MPKRPVLIIVAVLSVFAIGVVLWAGGSADETRPTTRGNAPSTNAATDTRAAVVQSLPASSAAQPAAATGSSPAMQGGDPFKAFLEASKNGQAPVADAAVQTASTPTAQDPFKAAFEAGRRPAPVPLVSPFGGGK